MTDPPEHVVRAFGLDPSKAPPASLDGGQGTSYLVEGAVLKPIDNAEEFDYVLSLQERLISLRNPHYRIPQPLLARSPSRTSKSRYLVSGWAGTQFLPGTENNASGRWTQMLAASRAFHTDLGRLVDAPPAFLARRTHRWARADLLIWDKSSADLEAHDVLPPVQDGFQRLLKLRRPLEPSGPTSQLVHGDLTGNFLFADDAQPTIIDLSLYWRPVEYAEAVIVADGLLDHGAGDELVDLVGRSPFRLEMLVRALLLRVLTDCESIGGRDIPGEDEALGARLGRAVAIVERCFRDGEEDAKGRDGG
jgi:uncharacterized protein (TIGR02569 family)